MNTRGNVGRGRGVATTGNIKVQPQAPDARVTMQVNPAGLTDTEVRTTLAHIAQAINVQDKAMMSQANTHDV